MYQCQTLTNAMFGMCGTWAQCRNSENSAATSFPTASKRGNIDPLQTQVHMQVPAVPKLVGSSTSMEKSNRSIGIANSGLWHAQLAWNRIGLGMKYTCRTAHRFTPIGPPIQYNQLYRTMQSMSMDMMSSTWGAGRKTAPNDPLDQTSACDVQTAPTGQNAL